jgi:hypothetical protein
MDEAELAEIRQDADIEYAPNLSYDDWQRHVWRLLAHIDQQAVTTETLKAALIEYSAEQYMYDAGRFGLSCQNPYDMARKVLAGKYPEIFGEVKE